MRAMLPQRVAAPSIDFSRRCILSLGVLVAHGVERSVARAEESMLEQARKLQYGLKDGRIRSCPSNLNPNCISTSSYSFDAYATPWRAPGGSLEQVANELVQIMPIVCKDCLLVAAQSSEDTEYLRFQTEGLLGPDYVEFLVKPSTIESRDWSGDTSAPLIFYRSISGWVQYIYPFQQPLSDFGTQKKRMERIRETLGWNKVGCELIECYQ